MRPPPPGRVDAENFVGPGRTSLKYETTRKKHEPSFLLHSSFPLAHSSSLFLFILAPLYRP